MRSARSLPPALPLLLLTAAAVLVHGYHLGVDDAEIHLPAVEKVFDPALFPFGAEFFLSHQRLSLFSKLVGYSARLLHTSTDVAIFAWYVFSVYALLWGCWRLACLCFEHARARWSAVALLSLLLTVPVAGTSLPIADPFLTARSLSTPATLLAVAAFVQGRRGQVAAWLLVTALLHPQMALYGIGFVVFLALPTRRSPVREREPVAALTAAAFLPRALGHLSLNVLPRDWRLLPAHGTYRAVLYMRTFFFASLWAWYEWVGAAAPLALLYLFVRLQPRGTLPPFAAICRRLIPFGLFSTAVFLLLGSTPRLENYVRVQPMRSFHVLYILFFLFLGGILGEYLLRRRLGPALLLFPALAGGMFLVQVSSYPHSRHIEWPGATPKNPWVQAFYWIRGNTPKSAIFALDPNYMAIAMEDQHGFRAVAERSVLADFHKDSGAVSMFPQLAPVWEQQQRAQQGWEHFELADYQRLARDYGVSWVVVQPPAAAGLACPYRNRAVLVCTVPRTPGAGQP